MNKKLMILLGIFTCGLIVGGIGIGLKINYDASTNTTNLGTKDYIESGQTSENKNFRLFTDEELSTDIDKSPNIYETIDNSKKDCFNITARGYIFTPDYTVYSNGKKYTLECTEKNDVIDFYINKNHQITVSTPNGGIISSIGVIDLDTNDNRKEIVIESGWEGPSSIRIYELSDNLENSLLLDNSITSEAGIEKYFKISDICKINNSYYLICNNESIGYNGYYVYENQKFKFINRKLDGSSGISVAEDGTILENANGFFVGPIESQYGTLGIMNENGWEIYNWESKPDFKIIKFISNTDMIVSFNKDTTWKSNTTDSESTVVTAGTEIKVHLNNDYI